MKKIFFTFHISDALWEGRVELRNWLDGFVVFLQKFGAQKLTVESWIATNNTRQIYSWITCSIDGNILSLLEKSIEFWKPYFVASPQLQSILLSTGFHFWTLCHLLLCLLKILDDCIGVWNINQINNERMKLNKIVIYDILLNFLLWNTVT